MNARLRVQDGVAGIQRGSFSLFVVGIVFHCLRIFLFTLRVLQA
jgi:hypothetical protein